MDIIRSWQSVPETLRGAVVALGNFDGVHQGHAHLLRTAHAARPGARLAVLTFEPHPREYFRPEDPPFRLTLAHERAEALARHNVQILFQLPFDDALSNLDATQFIDQVLHHGIGAAHLACGTDFAFGHRRSGDVSTLATQAEPRGIGLTIVPQLGDASGPISSTRIRRLLQDGYPERAAHELGRPWAIRGPVTHGDKRGRTIGFPTANIPLGQHLEPARGVYAIQATLPPSGGKPGSTVPGVANIGRRPTVSDTLESRVEAHLFDLDQDLYGQDLTIALHHFLRPERKFASFDDLRHQIGQDATQARKALAK